MPKKPREAKNTQPPQADDFKSDERRLECDEDATRFEARLGKIGHAKVAPEKVADEKSVRHVRIIMQPTAEKPDAFPLSVDAILDNSGSIRNRAKLFGLDGPFEPLTATRYPFIIHKDGTLDYGGDDGASEGRYASIDLLNGMVEPGRFVTVVWEGLTFRYQITDIISLF